MEIAKEELIRRIELARRALNESIDLNAEYEEIYLNSVNLDKLIEEYSRSDTKETPGEFLPESCF